MLIILYISTQLPQLPNSPFKSPEIQNNTTTRTIKSADIIDYILNFLSFVASLVLVLVLVQVCAQGPVEAGLVTGRTQVQPTATVWKEAVKQRLASRLFRTRTFW